MNENEVILPKYTKKSWLKSALLGFFVGLAVIVPGISGSTVAIIFKLYDPFLYALGNLFKKFKLCFLFLLPIAVGLVVGFVFGFLTVQKLLELLPFAVICLFAGLMSGAFPAVKDELKGEKLSFSQKSLVCLGVLIPACVGVCSVLLSSGTGTDVCAVKLWQVLCALPIGYLLGITQIVPGLSASAILMAIGWFQSLVDSVSFSFWLSSPKIFLLYLALGVGFLLGVFTFSKLLTSVFKTHRKTAYSLIVGLSLGSILTMFYNPDVFAVYQSWVKSGVRYLDLFLGIALFAVGFAVSYLLVLFERKKSRSETENAKTATEEEK